MKSHREHIYFNYILCSTDLCEDYYYVHVSREIVSSVFGAVIRVGIKLSGSRAFSVFIVFFLKNHKARPV